VWVVANFKETQLKNMRVGQPVSVQVDAVPGYDFKAHVDSFQVGTGSRFTLLPPENATGNFVKVVQRVPVKIVFDEPASSLERLWAGESVEPKVTVGKAIASRVHLAAPLAPAVLGE
jgi:membrane fusion protein (multidrug efflux system)